MNQLPRPGAALLLVLALVATFGAAGCVYRPNIQQGNLLEVTDIEQVTTGMTRSQVRYLLGTPMIADPFNPQRWDYIYTLTRGRDPKGERAHFVVRFEDDKVTAIERLDMPEARPTGGSGKSADDATREPPALPSIRQPQPDAPRPGGNDN